MKKLLLAIIAVILISGCAKPLSEDKADFVGLWKNNQTSLLITQSGRLEYESKKGSMETSISMPIKSIDDSQINAGFWIFSSTFKITGEPVEEDGMQVLTVNGEKLFKTDIQGQIQRTTEIPSLEKIRVLVEEDLTLLSTAINENDFTGYLKNSSLSFQSQFTNDKMKENYKTFIDGKVGLKKWMNGDFVLTKEPEIDENGILRIYGKYPNSPKSLKFKLSYIFSNSKWKGYGCLINITDE